MLPGFRFLFAAIMLSISFLVFGLGAASLLRAAHQAFAGNPSWHGTTEVTFAQRTEATQLTLAALRLEPQTAEKTPDEIASPKPAETIVNSTPVEAIAALKPADSTSPDPAKTDALTVEMPAAENSPATDAAPPSVEITEDHAIMTAAVATSDAAPEPSFDISPETSLAATKVATLGGPAVNIAKETPARKKIIRRHATNDQSTINKRVQARRRHRRQLAATRARLLAQQQTQQQQLNPFAPALTIPTTASAQ
ncbi:MAG TPA: hypothetical protein VKT76_16740 [Bradyrhizobium sp.]|nr:hypothetical protein [Bradyrhizobium sp.]